MLKAEINIAEIKKLESFDDDLKKSLKDPKFKAAFELLSRKLEKQLSRHGYY